ncbi:uncharacterized protein PGTG_12375 [Puccinia graminis f. sp. tritici CRL 75-36-700-3]|uniref:GATA-type domain-containing protein n=1 Tax=Puccinia graminis f. sp. tritici (strain CRL 75-36-700-3 / race SCCL) TaxID=418459 RepID=E3KQ44_PUCGT|nr:uncharacterized protein PGTG_12375 [Puccinia graminis f. sp. tritici CRL 75-36-700-3]EFP86419.1 hypothetical protein PGTG_12375 [Puccinia graminis f. sp. tritici CRL 75-36-700-3]
MNRRQHPTEPQPANPSRISQHRNRQLKASSPMSSHQAYQPTQPEQRLPRASTSTRRFIPANTSNTLSAPADQPAPKPSKRSITLTSPGWDPIGDDDALYIQSDDTHRRDLAGAGSTQRSTTTSNRQPRLDQTLLQARKRKRTSSQQPSFDRNQQPASRPSSSSQSSRPPLKHDAEGCSNCRTKQSTCWYKKSKPIILSDGSEAWGEEKLCNPCSIHWNKNGYHRSVRPRAPKQTNQPRPAIIPTRSSSSRARRPCPSDLPAGLSSPTASITKVQSTLNRPIRRSRSPSQLTLAAEREARIVKRSVAKANAKSDALRQRKGITKFGYISEEEDELYENPQLSPPLPPPRPTKHSSRKTSRSSISQKIDSNTRLASTRDTLRSSLCPGDASSSHHPKQNPTKINYPEEEPLLGSYSNHHLSSDPHPEPLQEDIYISPPRTPPPNSHLNPTKKLSPMRNSPGQLFDFGNVLSPSFLNGSPNSLLRRLNSQNHLIDTSTDASNLSGSYLSNFPSAAMPDKVFSPSRFLGSSNKNKPLPPVAEPSKKIEKSSSNPLLAGSVGLLDAHLNSGSSSGKSQNNKHFIFSPSRPALPKLKENQSIHSRKSKSIKASSSHETLNPMVPGPSKSRRLKKTSIESSGYREPLPAHLLPVSRTTSDSSLLAPPCPTPKTSTSGPSRKKADHHSSQQQSSKPIKQTMARTIWCRRLETTATTTTNTNGISSEDSQIEELFGQRMRGPSPLESRPSSEGLDFRSRNQARVGLVGGAEESGLSSAMFRGLPADLRTSTAVERGMGIGYSDGQLMAASSPPVLPPPSDCSEGITPLSAEPASDEPDHHHQQQQQLHHQLQSDFGKTGRLNRTAAELRLGSGPVLEEQDDLAGRSTIEFDLMAGEPTAGALADITDALNRHLRPPPPPPQNHHHLDSSSAQDPSSTHTKLDSLSPEIIAALSQAINAGLSASEIAQALRTLDDPPPPPGPSTIPSSSAAAVPNHFSYHPLHPPQHHQPTMMTTPTTMMGSSSLLNPNLIDPSLDDHPFASFLDTHSLLNNNDNAFITNNNTNTLHHTVANIENPTESDGFTRLQQAHPLIPSSTTTTTTTTATTNEEHEDLFSSFLVDNHDFFSGGHTNATPNPPLLGDHLLRDRPLDSQQDFVLSLHDIDGLLPGP